MLRQPFAHTNAHTKLPLKVTQGRLGRGLKPESTGERRQAGRRPEVAGGFVVTRGDASEVLEFIEEAFDEIALAVEGRIDRTLNLSVALGGNVRLAAALVHQIDDGPGVITAIGNESASWGQAVEQRGDGSLVGCLAGGEHDPQRQTVLVHDSIDLGTQSSTRTADGVIRAPFLPPAACWCARTIDESIRCNDCGERAAKVSKIRSQTPTFDQRL